MPMPPKLAGLPQESMMDATNSRRTFLKGAAVLGCSALIGPDHLLHGQNLAVGETRQIDLVIEGGMVIDGSGKAPFAADVGIVGSKIAAIGKLNDAKATVRINAQGLAVAPGFIDIHAHTNLRRNPKAQSKIFQGVTLDITGPDGGSPFPRRLKRDDTTEAPQSISEFSNYGRWVDSYKSTPIAMNLGSFVGFGTVRELVLGNSSRKPTIKELELMKDLVRQAMEQGALGLSSGLEYLPGVFASTEEIIEVARAAAEYGGVYQTHMRGEDQGVLAALDEAIRISRETGLGLVVTHFKVTGPPNWHMLDEAIAKIERARQEGLTLHCDRYPYTAWNSGFGSFYPTWASENGKLREHLKDPQQRKKMKPITEGWVEQNGGWNSLMISGGVPEGDEGLIGRRIGDLAEERGVEPYEFISDQQMKRGVSVIGFGMSQENTDRIIGLPYCAIASDGGAFAASKGAGGHPRSFGTFPRAIRYYVREKKTMPLEEIVRKMTSLPADIMGLNDRGRLKERMNADVVVFDAENITDKATYLEPGQYCQGVVHLVIHGQQVIKNGKQINAMSGKIVSRISA
jgi:N-acyl-D-aspartate/D-glutamate deacylase